MINLRHVGPVERLGYVFSAEGNTREYRVSNPSLIRERPDSGEPDWMIYRSVFHFQHPDPNLRASAHCDRAVLNNGTWTKEGAVLLPSDPWETGRSWNCFGVEDPRVERLPDLGLDVMAYCGGTNAGPRVAVAVSQDKGRTWRKLGYIHFPDQPHLNEWDNKNAVWLPYPVLSPSGRRCFALIHRAKPSMTRMPTFKHGVEDVEDAMRTDPAERPAMWIGYVPVEAALADVRNLTRIEETKRIFTPADVPWEPKNQVGLGAGSQFLKIPGVGWLTMYHTVHVRNYTEGQRDAVTGRYDLSHCNGLMLFDLEQPHKVLHVASPCFYPETPEELGDPGAPDLAFLSTKVVFVTFIEFETPTTLIAWYGAGDRHVARARVTLAEPIPGVA